MDCRNDYSIIKSIFYGCRQKQDKLNMFSLSYSDYYVTDEDEKKKITNLAVVHCSLYDNNLL